MHVRPRPTILAAAAVAFLTATAGASDFTGTYADRGGRLTVTLWADHGATGAKSPADFAEVATGAAGRRRVDGRGPHADPVCGAGSGRGQIRTSAA